METAIFEFILLLLGLAGIGLVIFLIGSFIDYITGHHESTTGKVLHKKSRMVTKGGGINVGIYGATGTPVPNAISTTECFYVQVALLNSKKIEEIEVYEDRYNSIEINDDVKVAYRVGGFSKHCSFFSLEDQE